MVLFGTGQKKPLSSTSGANYAAGTQTFYGIWDWNLADWNAKADGSSQYAAEPAGSSPTVTRSNLLSQTVVTTSAGGSANGINGYRTLSTTNNVCWDQTNTCTSQTNNQFGWYFDFPDTQEQDIYNPTLVGSAVVVNTAIPPTVSALACNPGLQSGWTMAFNVATGNGVAAGFFPGDGGQYGGAGDSATVSGIKTSAVGTPTTVMYNNQTYIINQTVNGTPIISNVNPANAVAAARVSWTELTP
jgi:type IV pilus assembly protein PilY1